ncbi:MAG: hypothetical protein K6E19_02725 [Lachnospiraceae bacterium]|nr:hypothetical protein [Lachnospiraceae bacterium]
MKRNDHNIFRRIGAVLLCAALILVGTELVPGASVKAYAASAKPTPWDGSVATGFAAGDGSRSAPYEIATPAQLAYLAKSVNDGNNYTGKYLKLTSDIDLNSKEWTPVGTDDDNYKFKGFFDGNGHSIYNLNSVKSDVRYIGLFGNALDTASIENLRVYGNLNISVTYSGSGAPYIGGIAGGAFKIENCVFIGILSVTVNETVEQTNVGGIAGFVNSGGASRCINYASVTANADRLGGVFGDANGYVDICHNYGTVSSVSTMNAHAIVGGIAGKTQSNRIAFCHNEGTVKSRHANDYLGGILGFATESVICCYNEGLVDGGYLAGGIVGTLEGGNIWHCYNKSNVKSLDYAGGIVGDLMVNAVIARSIVIGNAQIERKAYNNDAGQFAGRVPNILYTAENAALEYTNYIAECRYKGDNTIIYGQHCPGDYSQYYRLENIDWSDSKWSKATDPFLSDDPSSKKDKIKNACAGFATDRDSATNNAFTGLYGSDYFDFQHGSTPESFSLKGLAEPEVTITGQPGLASSLTYGGYNDQVLSVSTSVANVLYQWYECDDVNKTNATPITNEIYDSYNLPDNLSVGNHYYFCRVTGISNGNGMAKTVDSNVATVTVDLISLNDADVTLGSNQLQYDGTTQTVSVTVKHGSDNLTEGVDYTIAGNTATDKGAHTLTVTGQGNYTGTVSRTWSITEHPMTVSGNSVTCTYDGRPHGITVTVTEPSQGATVKYGITSGTCNLTESPTITNVEDSPLTVYYEVTHSSFDTYTGTATVTINKASSSIKTQPKALTLTENGTEQELVEEGLADGGDILYAIGDSKKTAPTTGWGSGVPKKSAKGTYYVWYKVEGDGNHNGIDPACVEVTIGEKSSGNTSGPSYSSSSLPAPAPAPAESKSYTDRMEEKFDTALALAIEAGNGTVNIKSGDSLPVDIMRKLKDHPDITLVYEYTYKDVKYRVVIKGTDAIIDDGIPWYGPLWLAAHYGNRLTNASE